MTTAPSQEMTEHWLWAQAPDRPVVSERGGKWLVFVPTPFIDRVWLEYAEATQAGRLGIAAKCATARQMAEIGRGQPVIVVYTRDYEDEDDVRRVLEVLRTELRVGQRLTYKTDAATLAGEYGDGVALYVSDKGSRDMRRAEAS